MGGGAAEVEAGDRRPVARVAGNGTEREELAGSHRALEDVAAREVEDALEVRRRQHLAVEDRALEVGRVRVEQVEAAVREGVTLVVPGSVAKLVRGVLHEHRHQMAAGRRDRRVDRRGDRALEDGLCGGAPVLGVVEGALDVVLVGTDVDGAAMLGARLGARQRVEVRQLGQGDVDLQRGAGVADPLDVGDEGLGQCAPVEQAKERHVGVGVAGHDGRVELVAVGERHADGFAVAHEDPRDLGLAADLGPEVAGSRRQRLREPAHAATHVRPDASRAAGLAHDVVEEHVRGARHRGARHCADDRVGGQGPLQLLRLEPAVEDRARRAGEDLNRLAGGVSQPPKRASQREHRPEVAWARVQEVGRSHRQRRLDHCRHALQHCLVLRVALCVACAELRDLPAGQIGIRAHRQRAPVGEGRER